MRKSRVRLLTAGRWKKGYNKENKINCILHSKPRQKIIKQWQIENEGYNGIIANLEKNL
jgi:hypothetical protein